MEKLFKAYDIRGSYPNPLNEEVAWKVGHATGQFLKRSRQNVPASERVRQEDSIIVGRDMRPHSPSLAKALMDGLRSTGMNVIDIGMVDTSMVYFAINHEDTVGGIQVTASHNPAGDNGFKISGPKAKPIGSATGLEDIKRIALKLSRVAATGVTGKYAEIDLWAPYRAHVRKFLNLGRKVRVAIDASNGMAGKMVPAIFGDDPMLEIIPVLFEITGSFVHPPNPLVEANLAQLKAKIEETKPDLGACFDGDADRCVFVTETAKMVGSDIATALIACDFLAKPENKGATVVYDLRSSKAVAEEITKNGGVPRRERVGHSFIKKAMAETNAVFGGELSGHFYFRDNFFADSGAIAFARLLSILSHQPLPFSQIVAPLQRYAQSGEKNYDVADKEGKIRDLAKAFKGAQVDYLDGISIEGGAWRINVRASNTEPKMRCNIEADTPQLLAEKQQEIDAILGHPTEGH